MWAWARITIPYITENGDIVMARRGSKDFPTVLSVRRIGGRYEASVVRQDSAEGRAVNSLYGMEVRGV